MVCAQVAAPEAFERAFRAALKRGVETGVFIQNKQSFRLSPAAAKKAATKPAAVRTARLLTRLHACLLAGSLACSLVRFSYVCECDIALCRCAVC
jgi:hypothetical protein